MLWHPKNLDMTKLWPTKRNLNFYSRFCEKQPFFWVRNDLRGLVCSFSKQSHLTVLTKKTNKTRSQVIPDPKKWPFFTKSAITRTWSKSDQNMSRTWQDSVYKCLLQGTFCNKEQFQNNQTVLYHQVWLYLQIKRVAHVKHMDHG